MQKVVLIDMFKFISSNVLYWQQVFIYFEYKVFYCNIVICFSENNKELLIRLCFITNGQVKKYSIIIEWNMIQENMNLSYIIITKNC